MRHRDNPNQRLCKWLKQLDSKPSPPGVMGSNPLTLPNFGGRGWVRIDMIETAH